MKFAIVLLAVIGATVALPTKQTRSLKGDLDDFLALIPKEKFVALYHKYENDADVQKIVAYLKSEDFAKVAHIIAHNSEIQDLVKYIEGKGVSIVDLINRLADRLGLPHWPTYAVQHGRQTRSIRDFINEAKALLPMDKLLALAMDKLANSEDFQDLYIKISEMDGNKIHDDALSHPEIVDLITRANAIGLDTKKVWQTLQVIFGWDSRVRRASTFTLRDDIHDYLALFDHEAFKAWWKKYENDAEVQAEITKIRAYLRSEKFAAIAHIIAHNDQIQGLVKYINDEGLPIIEYINKLADRLGLPHWPASRAVSFSTFSLQGAIDDIVALIPINEIIGLTMEKLANSESFQNLYIYISEMDGNKLHDDALTHPEIVELVEKAKAAGIDTEKIWNTVKSIFGW